MAFTALPTALPALPAETTVAVGNPTLNIAIFAGFVLVTLAVIVRIARGKKTAGEFYTALGYVERGTHFRRTL